MIRNPTAHDVDVSCRKGLFVFFGNRLQIMGAQTHLAGVPADAGKIWIHRLGLGWEQVNRTQVIITTESYSGKESNDMPRGKRADGSPTHLSAVEKSKGEVQPDLPGVEQEKIGSLERLIKKYQGFKVARMDATKLEVQSKEAVMKEMHNQGLTVYKRPGKFPFKCTLKTTGETIKVVEIDEDDVDDEPAEAVDDGGEEDENEE